MTVNFSSRFWPSVRSLGAVRLWSGRAGVVLNTLLGRHEGNSASTEDSFFNRKHLRQKVRGFMFVALNPCDSASSRWCGQYWATWVFKEAPQNHYPRPWDLLWGSFLQALLSCWGFSKWKEENKKGNHASAGVRCCWWYFSFVLFHLCFGLDSEQNLVVIQLLYFCH